VTNERTIGVGIIGTGFARTTQLPAWASVPGARLVALREGRTNVEGAATFDDGRRTRRARLRLPGCRWQFSVFSFQ
jgi:predicted dehydrogenase